MTGDRAHTGKPVVSLTEPKRPAVETPPTGAPARAVAGAGRVVVCLPTYNERENLERMLRALGDVLPPDALVLVIDDASPDGTGELAERLAHELGFVGVLHRSAKDGLGRAYVAGFRRALELGAEFVVQIDCDFSHDPREIPALLSAAQEADLVIGSRYTHGGSIVCWSRPRRAISRLGSLYARLVLAVPVRDLTGGFKCYRRAALEALDLDRLRSHGYSFQIESTYLAHRAGLRVVERPIAFTDRAAGTSKMNASIALEAVARVPALRFSRGRAPDEVGRRARFEIAAWWLGSRAVVVASALAVQVFGWPRPRWRPSLIHHPLALLGIWDGRWYRIVAERGYLALPGRPSDTAFFPAFSILERGLAAVGLPVVSAGLLIANAGFLLGLVGLYVLGRELLPEPDARRAAVYAAIFPMGFVFSMAYPEGLVLPAVTFGGFFALRDRWLACAPCAAAAALARPEGVFLAIPLAAIAVRRWPSLSFGGRIRSAGAVLAGPLALAAFPAYLWWSLGDPLAWNKAEHAWNRSFSALGVVRAAVELVGAPTHHKGWLFRDAAFCLLYVCVLLLALGAGVPRSWVAAGGLVVLLPLTSGSFTSDARFGLLAVPVYWGLAVAGRRGWLDRAVRTVSPALLAAGVFTLLLRFP
jgi:dolichol-phosphate mannosyltransferase